MVIDQPDFTSIAGVVSANVVPNVQFIGQYSAAPGVISGLGGYNALIVVTELTGSAQAVTDYASFLHQVTQGDAANLLDVRRSYLQGFYYSGNAGSAGDATYTQIPLSGGDACNITWDESNTAGVLSQTVFGTTEVLPYAHYTKTQRVDNSAILAANGMHLIPTGGAKFPVPISTRKVRIYFHFDAGSSASSINVRMADSVTGVQQMVFTNPNGYNAGVGQVYNGTGVSAVANAGKQWIDLPHSSVPMQLTIDAISGTNHCDIVMEETEF